jgi:hypothetical protein
MNFNRNNFLFKEKVNTFVYTTATQNRDVYTDVSINGRRYRKYGTLQAVTFVGNLYKVGCSGEGYWPKEDGPIQTSKNEKYVLVIGMSKQHPYDTKVNKELGYEIAQTNMLNDPCMVIEVQGKFTKRRFVDLIEYYISTMKLEFIKTRGEIIAEGKDPKNYNR